MIAIVNKKKLRQTIMLMSPVSCCSINSSNYVSCESTCIIVLKLKSAFLKAPLSVTGLKSETCGAYMW
jgi:hypothetical protein